MSRLGRLASDRRGRVPFAVVAALLLVSSATFASSLPLQHAVTSDDATDDALDRVGSTTRSTLRAAVDDAARDAAGAPVTATAPTAVGDALERSGDPFRAALELRIYLAAQRRLGETRYRTRGVSAGASLPPIENVSDVPAALDHVTVEGVDDGTAIRVTVRNVSLVAREAVDPGVDTDSEAGGPLARETETYRVTVETPVLTMHRRTSRFERRLDAGALQGPGLGRQLTARLYPIAWARSGLQYTGTPIQNVVTNRHVALATNGGVLATQRATFGRADPDAESAQVRAAARTGATDVLTMTPEADERALELLPPINDPIEPTPPPDIAGRRPTVRGTDALARAPSPDDELVVGVNRSADAALLGLLSDGPALEHESAPELRAVFDAEYRAEATLRHRVVRVRTGRSSPDAPPGDDWTHVGGSRREWTTVSDADGPVPRTPPARTVAVHTRRVVEHHEATHTWRDGNRTRETTDRWRHVSRVGFAVVVDGDANSAAPAAPVEPRFARGGALNGPNFRDVPDAARGRLVDRVGGPDAVAEGLVDGSTDSRTIDIEGECPASLRSWVERDLVGFGSRVRNVSVTVTRGAVASGRANPPALLAAELRDRRATLLDAPDRYDGVADRARVAARAAYLDAVLRRLDARAERHRATTGAVDEAMSEAGAGSTDRAAAVMDARTSADPARDVPGQATHEGRPARMVPDTAPAHLTLSTVPDNRTDVAGEAGYRPLVARNINVFTVPYGDAVDSVVEDSGGEPAGRVGLGTAGRALVAANRTLERVPNRSLEGRRDALRRSVDDALVAAHGRARETVARHPAFSPADAAAIVDAAVRRHSTTGTRAVAAANGSFAAAVADEAVAHGDLSQSVETELRLRLRIGVARVVEGANAQGRDARVPVPVVENSSREVGAVVRQHLKPKLKEKAGNLTARAARRQFGDRFAGVPAGLPLLPVPGYWVATVNVWHVEVRGAYARFTLRAGDGGQRGPTTYVRDGSDVFLDVDGDGVAERLGTNEHVSFETETVVLVAVPPSGRGVGDVDGNADESSDGWPCPGLEPSGEACDRG